MDIKSCSFCSEKAVYRRKYSGESLCTECFKNSIVEKTRKTISKYKMLKYGEKIAIGLSGGKDSSALLDVLNQITKSHGSKLYAITIDEGIEGYRDESKFLAEKMCKSINVPQIVVSYDELFDFTLDEALKPDNRKLSSCSVCGPLRRRAIDLAAQKINADVIATAHNLDDSLQTFFMNLFNNDLPRISWLNPLSSGFKSDIRRIKPFMDIYEEEIAYYTYLMKIDFQVEDCPYQDESIRSEVREFLNNLERLHPGIKYSTFSSAMKMAQKSSEITQKDRIKCKKCGQLSSQPICSVCKTINIVNDSMQIYASDQ